MTEELPERDLLRMIDPAPRAVDPVDEQRHLRLVQRRIQDRRERFRVGRVVPFAVPVAAAALAAALVVPALHHPAAVEPTTTGGTAPQQTAYRAGDVTRSGVRVLASQRVGTALLLLGARNGERRFGASFAGSDPDRNWDRFHPPAAPVDGISMGEVSNFPDAIPGGLAVIAGAVGSDVIAVDVRTHAGGTERAVLANGLWLAGWNGRDFDDRDTLDTVFVLHLRDGSTRTVSYLSLSDG